MKSVYPQALALFAAILLSGCGGGSDSPVIAPDGEGRGSPQLVLSVPALCINGDAIETDADLWSGVTITGLPSYGPAHTGSPGVTLGVRSAAEETPYRDMEITASLATPGTLSIATSGQLTISGPLDVQALVISTGDDIDVSGELNNSTDANEPSEIASCRELTAPPPEPGPEAETVHDPGEDESGWGPGGLAWTGELTVSEHGKQFVFAEIAPVPDLEAPAVPLTAHRIDGIFMHRGPNIDGLILMRIPDCDGSRNCNAWHLNPRHEPSWYGLDESFAHQNAHLERHYHGLSEGLLADYSGVLRQVGMAADGYPIVNGWFDDDGLVRRATSSYQLKTGYRSPGFGAFEPVGPFNGEYVEDYEYVAGSGDLDECNGMVVNGVYSYFVTAEFPYLMNCLRGTPHDSFLISPP